MNDSWDGARRHPALTVIGLFVAGFVGVALGDYFTTGGENLYASVVIGLGCGMVLALFGWQTMREGVDAVSRELRPVTAFNLLTAVAGAVLLVLGIATVKWSLALSGAPLLVLGIGLMFARRLLSRRNSGDST